MFFVHFPLSSSLTIEVYTLLRQISSPVASSHGRHQPNHQKLFQIDRRYHTAPSRPLDESTPLFSGKNGGKAKQSDPTAEEIADFKLKNSKAPQIRSVLPTILKLWSPLPQQSIARHGHITKFVTALENSPTASRSETLLQRVRALVDNPQPNELHKAEAEFFNVLSSIQASLAKGSTNTAVLLNALPPGHLRDACIAYVLQQGRGNIIRLAAAKELQMVQKSAMQASLQAMVRHSPDFAVIRQLLDKSQAYHMESPNPWLKYLADDAYYLQTRKALEQLYSQPPLEDDDKRQIILSIMNDKDLSFAYSSVTPVVAALGTFQDSKKQADLIEELQKSRNYYLKDGLKLATNIQAPEQIAQLDKETALPSLAVEGLRPFIDRGFSLLDAPQLASLLEMTGRDAGTLITTILPAYDEVLDFALKHPDKLVKTGSKPPSEDEIRAGFYKQGVLIMQALILTGIPTLKSTIYRKRLDNLLDLIPSVIKCPELLKPVHQLSNMTEEPADNYKLLEFIASFSKMQKEKELQLLMGSMVQNKKLDIKAIGKAYLTAAFDSSRLRGIQISDDQADKWDMKYMSTLASALRDWRGHQQEELIELCKAALQGRIQSYLHDPATKVGKNNLATQNAFATTFEAQGLKLDYQQWLHYPGEVVFKHLSREEEKQTITQATNDLFSEIQTKYPALWPPIQEELLRNNLPVTNGKLQSLSQRSGDEMCLKETLRSQTLFKEPSFKERIDYLIKRIDNLTYAPLQTQQMRIKLWERNPGTDLFLGNYTGACIALDSYGDNSYASVQANQNTFVQVAYLYDGANKVVGKGLFYWGKNIQTGEPVLILNTFEGRAARNDGYEYNMQIRDKYVEFAKQYSRAVLGYAAPLYTATDLNPLYQDDLKESPINMHVVGNALNNQYYLDSLPDRGDKIDTHHKPNRKLQMLDCGEPRPQSANINSTLITEGSPARVGSVAFEQSPVVIQTRLPSIENQRTIQNSKKTATQTLKSILKKFYFPCKSFVKEASPSQDGVTKMKPSENGKAIFKKMLKPFQKEVNS